MDPTASVASLPFNLRDHLFTEVGRRMGLLEESALDKGRRVLAEMAKFGIRAQLVTVMVDRKLLERDTVRAIIAELGAIQVACASCRERTALKELSAEAKVRCGRCSTLLVLELRDAASAECLEGDIAAHLKTNLAVPNAASAPAQALEPTRRSSEPETARTPGRQRPDTTRQELRLERSPSVMPPSPSGAPSAAAASAPAAAPVARASAPAKAATSTSTGTGKKPPTTEKTTAKPSADGARRNLLRRYRTLQCLHQGPFGRLYRARRVRGESASPEGPELALTIFDPGLEGRSGERCAALRERLEHWNAAPLSTPNLPHNLERDGELWYLVRAFLQSPYTSLAELQPRSLEERRRVVADVTARLAEFHRCGRVHGNLKPGNILYLPKPEAAEVRFTEPCLQVLTPQENELERWSFLARAPQCCPPELVAGQSPTPASDVYSLGWIFHALLSGEAPFAGLSGAETLMAQRHGPCPELPEDQGPWRALVQAMTAVNPSERPADAGAVLQHLTEIREGKSPRLAPPSPRPPRPALDSGNGRRDKAAPKGLLARARLAQFVVGPLALALAVGWCAHCVISWGRARAALRAPDRNTALFQELAASEFRRTLADARQFDAPKAHALWERFLEVYGQTDLEGAAKAEQRNLPKLPPKPPAGRAPTGR